MKEYISSQLDPRSRVYLKKDVDKRIKALEEALADARAAMGPLGTPPPLPKDLESYQSRK